jgi:hypothetical protein
MNAMFLAASLLIFILSFSCIGAGWTVSLVAACASNLSLWLAERVVASQSARSERRNWQQSVLGLAVRRVI